MTYVMTKEEYYEKLENILILESISEYMNNSERENISVLDNISVPKSLFEKTSVPKKIPYSNKQEYILGLLNNAPGVEVIEKYKPMNGNYILYSVVEYFINSKRYKEAIIYLHVILQDAIDKLKKEQERLTSKKISSSETLESIEFKIWRIVSEIGLCEQELSKTSLNEVDYQNIQLYSIILKTVMELTNPKIALDYIKILEAKICEELEEKQKSPLFVQSRMLLEKIRIRVMLLEVKCEKELCQQVLQVPDTQDGGSWNITSAETVYLAKK